MKVKCNICKEDILNTPLYKILLRKIKIKKKIVWRCEDCIGLIPDNRMKIISEIEYAIKNFGGY